jgi:transglutaminase-like putative cysteine protease
MRNKSCCNRSERRQATNWKRRMLHSAMAGAAMLAVSLGIPRAASGGDAPAWMHALVSAPVPGHDEKTDAVLLYSEDVLTVKPDGKMKRLMRRAYRILRVTGKEYGTVEADYDGETKILSLRGWCIPAQGKDYEVKDKDAIETSIPGVLNGELVTDIRTKLLPIPAAEPGSIVGYEIEQEERPFVYQDLWRFQHQVPVREARFTLQLPPGWEYKATWLNYAEAKESGSGNNQWQWVVSDVKAIKKEDDMPPWAAVAGQLLITLLPPGGADRKAFESWSDIGRWEGNLEQGRRDPSPPIAQKVNELTAGKKTTTEKMRALADFVQRDIRYVAIELGIGGVQPHPAREIYDHHYGDCKDKATLMGSMLKEIGVESYYISINTTRGAVTAHTPPHPFWFNHEIIGVRLPEDVKDAELVAIYQHPKIGRILIFDPTDEMTPFGQLRGELQANYGLLVTPEGGDLIELPQLPASASGVHRVGKFQLAANGGLAGDITEVYVGDNATRQRYFFRAAQKDTDRVKYLESLLSGSLSTYQITKASVGNVNEWHLPFQYQYSIQAPNYAKTAGDLLLVRPRVVGHASRDLLEKKEPRQYPVEFEGPEKNVITYDITLPAGYEVDDLPPPVDVDYSFGSYHAKTVSDGNVLKYTRTLEIKQVSVPVSQAEDLKKFYRVIASDERNTAVLKPAGKR